MQRAEPPRRGGDGAGGAGRGGAARDHRAAGAGGRQAANIDEIDEPADRDRRAADTSEREYEEQARLQEERRAALAEARQRAGERRVGDLGARARASPGGRPSGRGAVQRRDDLAARVEACSTEETAAGERLDGADRRGAAPARRDRRRCGARSRRRAARGGRGRGAPGGGARRAFPRRAGAGDAARGGASPAIAAGVADGDPGPLRALSEGRPRDHAGAPRGGRRRRHQGRRRRHRAAAARSSRPPSRRCSASGWATSSSTRTRRASRRSSSSSARARGGRRSSRAPCARTPAAGEVAVRRDVRGAGTVRDARGAARASSPIRPRSPPPGRRATVCAGRCSS